MFQFSIIARAQSEAERGAWCRVTGCEYKLDNSDKKMETEIGCDVGDCTVLYSMICTLTILSFGLSHLSLTRTARIVLHTRALRPETVVEGLCELFPSPFHVRAKSSVLMYKSFLTCTLCILSVSSLSVYLPSSNHCMNVYVCRLYLTSFEQYHRLRATRFNIASMCNEQKQTTRSGPVEGRSSSKPTARNRTPFSSFLPPSFPIPLDFFFSPPPLPPPPPLSRTPTAAPIPHPSNLALTSRISAFASSTSTPS